MFQLDIPQKLKEWSENFPSEKILSENETFESLQQELNMLVGIGNRQIPLKAPASSQENNVMNAFEELMACINGLLTNPELAFFAYADYNRFSENSCNPSGYNSFVPLCISPTTKEGLLHYLGKFVAPNESLEELSESELLELYSRYTPQKAVKIPSHEIASTNCSICSQNKTMHVRCYYCGSGQCSECPVNTLSFPQLHITEKHVFCNACVELLHQECTDLWLEKATSHIQGESIYAALGCMSMAVYSGGKCDTKIFKCIKALYKKGFSLAALPPMVNLIQTCTNTELLIQARYFLANMLQYIARKNCPENGRDNLFFLLASATAFNPESIYDGQVHSSIDLPNLPRLQKEVQSGLDQRQLSLLSEYKRLWHAESYRELFNFLGKEKSAPFIDAESNEVLKKFITDRQTNDINNEEERNVLLFLRGMLSINEGKYSEGVEDIETAIWNHHSPPFLQQEAVTLMIRILPNCLSVDDPKALLNAGTLLESSAGKVSSRISNLVFAMAFELEPPLKNMLARGILTLDYSMHQREDATLRHFQQGMLTKQEVAIEYVALMETSSNYSQNIMCHLLASLWYLQHLHDIPESSKAERFAVKKLIIYLLDQVLLKTRVYHSHPGFQLYAEIIALKIITNILQTNKDIISQEDNELAARTLSVVLHKSRMCPLWDTPIVLVSEVDHIDEVTNALHSKYLQGLEDMDTTQLPIHKADLMYYLYEDDLRCSKSNKIQGPPLHYYKCMDELLKEKNWTFDDVVQRMTSPMDPRDSEGWLIPTSGRLGVSYEYSELKGMVINLSPISSSIALVFEPATPEKPGVLSKEDVLSIMQLDFDDIFPLHFSLDPPDVEKPYHPFQEVAVNKKLPRAIQHTLLQTDYLMKSFSVGSDISSVPPFKQRVCKDGLTKHLPPSLQEATRSIPERPGQKSGMSMSRFWIQADSVSYEASQTGSRYEYRFGDVDIKVRSHPIIPSPDGNLHDTAEDLDPDSAEAHFAADLTNNYKELSRYFPQYARLYEFGKLQAVKMVLHSIELHLKKKTCDQDIFTPHCDLPAVLRKFKHSPIKTDSSGYWVPAALHEEYTLVSFSRCYGGVLFAPQLVDGSVARFSPTTLSVPIKPPKTDEEDDDSFFAAELGLLRLHATHMKLNEVPKISSRTAPNRNPSGQERVVKPKQANPHPKQSLGSSCQPVNTRQHQQLQALGQQDQKASRQAQQPVRISHTRTALQGGHKHGLHKQPKHPVVARKQQSAAFPQPSRLGEKQDHSVLPKSQLSSASTKSFVPFAYDAKALKNSALSDFVSKQAEDTPSTSYLQIPVAISQKISLQSSLLTARIFTQTHSLLSANGGQLTFQPLSSANLCPCSPYRCLISHLISTDTFKSLKTGENYKMKDCNVDCKMRNMIYMVEICDGNGHLISPYIGLTTQEFWKRIYQHLTDAYNRYISGTIKDPEKRRFCDQLAATVRKYSSNDSNILDDSSNNSSYCCKKKFVEFLTPYVKIRPLAFFIGENLDDMQQKLYEAESVLIAEFGTDTHGANKTRGLIIDDDVKIDESQIYITYEKIKN